MQISFCTKQKLSFLKAQTYKKPKIETIMEPKQPAATVLNRSTPKTTSNQPTKSTATAAKSQKLQDEMIDATRSKAIAKLVTRFSKLTETEMQPIFAELTGDPKGLIRFLSIVKKYYGGPEKAIEEEYPYLKMHKQFMIDKQLKSQKALEFKRKYYLQFKMIADGRKANGDNIDQIYRDLAQFLSKISIEETKSKDKRIYFTGKELRELMETIEELEKS